MHKYRLISKKGEGTFSEVLKAQSIKSGKFTAIKCMKNHFDSISQVNNLREIQALRRLAGHPNIIKLHEVLYDEPTGRLALVFELMDMNLYEAIKGRRHYLPEAKVKQYMYELLKALDHMHRNGIFHRDVKPENLLLLDDEIKLADLGSCRGIYSRQPYTEYISTRWYRAPECLLTDGYYNFKMDLFAAGCVWFEIVALFPLFPGQNEMDQIQKIHNVLGTPSPELLNKKFKRNASHMDFNFPEKKGTGVERLVPHADPDLLDLLNRLIRYDPDERLLARQALKDQYFRELRDAEKERLSAAEKDMRSSKGNLRAGMSASSSSATVGVSPDDAADAAPGGAGSPPPDDRNGALPNIRNGHERRKAPQPHAEQAAAGPPPPGRVQDGASGDLGGPRGRGERDRGDQELSPGMASSEGEEPDDAGALLPPIDVGRGKVDAKGAKPRVVKATGASGALSTSKGFAGTLSSSVGGGLGQGAQNAHARTQNNWGGAQDAPHAGGAGAVEKMNSTWAPSQHPRKYVSPFSHKMARDPSTGKKR